MPDGYFIILIVMSVLFHFLFPIEKIIYYPFSLIGIILVIGGILVAFVTNSVLLKERTSIKPFENPCELVTSGLFKFSRNPIYLGMMIALFGVEIILGSLFSFIFPIIFVIIINKTIIPVEEKNLERLFGKKYLDYKKKVGRWI